VGMAQSLDQLKAKYQSVLNSINAVNGSLKNLNMEGENLLIRADVPNDQLKNTVWDSIKAVDPSYSDLIADINVNSSLQAPAAAVRTYTVQSGDTLSRIAQHFYNKASEYPKIFEANRDKLSDPDKIKVGMELVIPE
jgi:nucleoid-associated protein YgaU